jgi:hypothetical protein
VCDVYEQAPMTQEEKIKQLIAAEVGKWVSMLFACACAYVSIHMHALHVRELRFDLHLGTLISGQILSLDV